MSASTQTDQDLSRREEMTVSGAAMSAAPWGAAVVTGGVVAVGDLGLHVIGAGLGLGALSGSVAMGAVAFFVVAAAGALWRARPSRAIRWARSNPWRFAVMPALACAAIALVLSVVTGGGIIDPVLSGLWHGGLVYGLTGAAGVFTSRGSRPPYPQRLARSAVSPSRWRARSPSAGPRASPRRRCDPRCGAGRRGRTSAAAR